MTASNGEPIQLFGTREEVVHDLDRLGFVGHPSTDAEGRLRGEMRANESERRE